MHILYILKDKKTIITTSKYKDIMSPNIFYLKIISKLKTANKKKKSNCILVSEPNTELISHVKPYIYIRFDMRNEF